MSKRRKSKLVEEIKVSMEDEVSKKVMPKKAKRQKIDKMTVEVSTKQPSPISTRATGKQTKSNYDTRKVTKAKVNSVNNNAQIVDKIVRTKRVCDNKPDRNSDSDQGKSRSEDDFVPDYDDSIQVAVEPDDEFLTDDEMENESTDSEIDKDEDIHEENTEEFARQILPDDASEAQFNVTIPDVNVNYPQDIEAYINSVIDKRWKQKEKQEMDKLKKGMIDSTNQINDLEDNVTEELNMPDHNITRVKSPSDTTIYAPGLAKTGPEKQVEQMSMVNKISDFIEGMRVEDKRRRSLDKQMVTSLTNKHGAEGEPGTSTGGLMPQITPSRNPAKELADRKIIEAEKFKASLTTPKGNYPGIVISPTVPNFQQNGPYVGMDNATNGLLEDDEFFHITCHVDPTLRGKIEKREFVDLERLLAKERFRGRGDEPGHLEFYSKDGYTYLAPANRDYKITNVHRWEQAFRVYAAIYSNANPSRAAEIWQYVYVINSAASICLGKCVIL